MPRNCARSTSGGKGNMGMFIERDKNVCAAGVPSAQAEQNVADTLKHYCLQDEVDALIRDSIIPPPKPRRLPPLRHIPKLDMRNAGPFSEAAQLINPPVKTKFQTLVEDFKNTVYTSYWKKEVGTLPDPVPTLPTGFDVYSTRGMKTPDHGRLYDVVMPKTPNPGKIIRARESSYQVDRNYCKPSYNPNLTFGIRSNTDIRGRYMKCCLQDDRIPLGNALYNPINSQQVDFMVGRKSCLGTALAPNDNISNVPRGYTFGKLKPPDNLPECLTMCEMNTGRDLYKKCLAHLNSLRKCLKKRYDGPFFRELYLKLKYFDKEKTGWLPKDTIYEYCATRLVRFNPSLLEPLFTAWKIFDGRQLEYKTLVYIINHTQPLPVLPKVPDVPDECIDFRTTYSVMVDPRQETDKRLMAGLPSGRYLDRDYPVTPDGCCKADRFYLPHESDAKSCLCPSILTLLGVSHRDMYASRAPEQIRKVFGAAGEEFTDQTFDSIWNEAKKYHSQGLVCYETFRRALNKANTEKKG